MRGVKLWDIWRPFKRENYRCAWNDRKLLGIVRQFCVDVKYTYQRARYGYCDLDLWNIDSRFLDIIPRMLEEHRDTRHGIPVVDGTDEKTCHDEWTNILNRMIFLFREASEDTCTKINPYEEFCMKYFDEHRKIAEYREKCKDEALAMFTKYFYGLWD